MENAGIVKKKKKINCKFNQADRKKSRMLEIICIVLFAVISALTIIDYFYEIF